MKRISIILLNALAAVSSTIVMIISGLYSPDEEGWLFFFWIWLIIITPIFSIILIARLNHTPSESWFSLVLKRKVLEEKQRIAKLENADEK